MNYNHPSLWGWTPKFSHIHLVIRIPLSFLLHSRHMSPLGPSSSHTANFSPRGSREKQVRFISYTSFHVLPSQKFASVCFCVISFVFFWQWAPFRLSDPASGDSSQLTFPSPPFFPKLTFIPGPQTSPSFSYAENNLSKLFYFKLPFHLAVPFFPSIFLGGGTNFSEYKIILTQKSYKHLK